jgi:hypothetical protein
MLEVQLGSFVLSAGLCLLWNNLRPSKVIGHISQLRAPICNLLSRFNQLVTQLMTLRFSN